MGGCWVWVGGVHVGREGGGCAHDFYPVPPLVYTCTVDHCPTSIICVKRNETAHSEHSVFLCSLVVCYVCA